MKSRGFTLVEILVVISVIGLLMAIIFPVASRSRQEARTIVCSANIRQLLFGLFTYDSQHGRFPYGIDDLSRESPSGGYAGYWQYDRMGWYWFNYTMNYSRENSDGRDIIFCPSKPLNNTLLETDVLRGNYGVNLSICKSSNEPRQRAEFAGTSLSLADLPHPAQTLLIADAGYCVIAWVHATDEPPFALTSRQGGDSAYVPGLSINGERTNLLPQQEYDAFSGRHPGKTVNVGFADGHVSREKAESLLVEKTNDGYRDLSPLWRPR